MDACLTAPCATTARKWCGIASSVAEASATFTPSESDGVDRPGGRADDAGARRRRYKNEFAAVARELASKQVSAQAQTISAGVEAIGPQDASVAVIMRGTQNVPGKPADVAVLALRITLSKDDGRWLVDDVTPINSR